MQERSLNEVQLCCGLALYTTNTGSFSHISLPERARNVNQNTIVLFDTQKHILDITQPFEGGKNEF